MDLMQRINSGHLKDLCCLKLESQTFILASKDAVIIYFCFELFSNATIGEKCFNCAIFLKLWLSMVIWFY